MTKIKLFRIGFLFLGVTLAVATLLYLMEINAVRNYYTALKNKLPEFIVGSPLIEATGAAERERELALLAEEELTTIREGFLLRESALALKEQELLELEQTLTEERAALVAEREEILNTRERTAALEAEAESYANKVLELATRFYNMPPQNASERILALGDDILIIDVLERMDEVAGENDQTSIVPFLLSLMPAEDSARILKTSTIGL